MFRAIISPILRSTSTVYTAFGTMRRQQCRCIVPKAVYTYSRSAPEDGQNYRPKHAELI
jgi:hypothetical protein